MLRDDFENENSNIRILTFSLKEEYLSNSFHATRFLPYTIQIS